MALVKGQTYPVVGKYGMVYINSLSIPSAEDEFDYLCHNTLTCYQSYYPFGVFGDKGFSSVSFAPVTVFGGGNGSGKSTLLNVIAQKTDAKRHSMFSKGAFFEDYVSLCRLETEKEAERCEILTSDDVFDIQLDIRAVNNGIDNRRNLLFEKYSNDLKSRETLSGLDDYERWKDSFEAKRLTKSEYIRRRTEKNPEIRSNGESAMKYFVDRIESGGLYFLDEPENSLSVPRQKELAEFIYSSARFFSCQFIIATHSPIFFSIRGARIYDLGSSPVKVKKWTEMENVRAYFEFFDEHREEFEK